MIFSSRLKRLIISHPSKRGPPGSSSRVNLCYSYGEAILYWRYHQILRKKHLSPNPSFIPFSYRLLVKGSVITGSSWLKLQDLLTLLLKIVSPSENFL